MTQEMLPGMPIPQEVLPRVDGMTVPFVWTAVSDIMGKKSIDLADYCSEHDDYDTCVWGGGITNDFLTQEKRSDRNYQKLLRSIREEGFLDPIFYGNETMGNGHHRLAIAIDCGYTHVPTTDDPEHEYRDSGVGAS